jgi:hypothetical protein
MTNQVALGGDASRGRGLRRRPAALHEERRSYTGVAEGVEDSIGVPGRAPRPVGVFGVERQRHAQRRPVIHGW